MVEWIAKDLEVTTLRYQAVEDMIEAIGLPREKLCLYCWTGECPKKECKTEKERAKGWGKAIPISREKVTKN